MYFDRLLANVPTREFWFKHGLPALVLAIFMLLVYPVLQIDRYLADFFFDPKQHHFPLKHYPFLELVMHAGLKWLMVVIALGCLAASVLGGSAVKSGAYKKPLLWVFAGMVFSTSVVAILKRYNQHGCPWDIDVYGGNLPLFDLFASLPAGAEAGHCFPAGHPSGGFALMAFYFAFMHSRPRLARNMLWVGVTTGLLMGFAQMMRGAHFLSHVLWSGWVVWASLLLLYSIWSPSKLAAVSKM